MSGGGVSDPAAVQKQRISHHLTNNERRPEVLSAGTALEAIEKEH